MDVYIVLRHAEDGAEVATIQPTEERAKEMCVSNNKVAWMDGETTVYAWQRYTLTPWLVRHIKENL